MNKFKFLVLLILLCVISFSLPVAIGSKLFATGFIVLIVLRIAFKVKMNKIQIENENLLNEKLKNDRDK